MKKSFFQSMVLGTCGSRGEINKLYSVSCRGRLRFLKGRTVLKDPTRYCTCVVWINPGVEEFIQVQCSEQKQEAQKPVSSWKFQGSFHKAISINTYKRKQLHIISTGLYCSILWCERFYVNEKCHIYTKMPSNLILVLAAIKPIWVHIPNMPGHSPGEITFPFYIQTATVGTLSSFWCVTFPGCLSCYNRKLQIEWLINNRN